MTHRVAARGGHPVWLWATAAFLCLLAPVGCTRSKPAMAPRAVALEMPPPPARVISTPPEPVAPTEATTVDRPAPASRPARTTRAAQARPDPVRPAEPPRADAPADPAGSPATSAAEPPVNTGPLLRTPQTADEANAEKRTRDVLNRAVTLLDRTSPGSLGPQARQQHDTARRFVDQAKTALSERNYVLAASLADKAETLARGLSR
jgi:hypothetical protein